MTEYYGVDSATPIGSTFASAVDNYFSHYSSVCSFWGRYIYNQTSSYIWSNNEIAPMVANGIGKMLPIDENVDVGGSSTQGLNDGQTMAAKVWYWTQSPVSGYSLSFSSDEVMLFLDVENTVLITQNYWAGWAFGVAGEGSSIDSSITWWPCAYIGGYDTSTDGTDNGNNIAAVGCFGMWGVAPGTYTADGPGQVGWPPPYGPSGVAVRFWQYNYSVAPSGFGFPPHTSVDLNCSNPTESGPDGSDSLLNYLLIAS